jgi:hypothetical protein
MLILAIFGTAVHLFHRADRLDLNLRHEPGTIASAVSIGAKTGMGELLAGRQDEKEIAKILKDKKFRIDPLTNRIIMNDEEGYHDAFSPDDRRRSVFARMQGQGRLDRRMSQAPVSPS